MDGFDFPLLLFVLCAICAIRLSYLALVFMLGIKKDVYPENINLVPVSIVISARNEADNLMTFLPIVLEQDYPNFEVIVVNDRSVDETEDILRAFKVKYPRLFTTAIAPTDQHWAGKKYALTIGVKAAKNDFLLHIDADCYPQSKNWIREMVKRYTLGKEIIVGYGPYSKTSGLLNALIRSETSLIASQYLSLAKIGIPYMGVGRNLSYKKDLFFQNKGFASHMELMSGDDDLFINEVAKNKNVGVAFDSDANTVSVPESSFSAWLEQKRRHLTTSIHYKWSTQIVLLLQYFSAYLFYILAIISIFVYPSWYPIYGVIPVFWLLMIGALYPLYKRMGQLDLLIWAPITDVFILLFYPVAYFQNLILSGNPWKNY